MALRVKRTGSDDYGRTVKMLVCGEPGAGKTKQAATWPNPLYVNAEGGLMSIAEQNLPVVDLTSTDILLELKNILQQPAAVRERELGAPVDTVVIDTIDEVARIFIKERLEASGKDVFQIADWGWLGDQLRAVVRTYRNLPMNVIINCHLKTQTDEETGKMFVKPAIQGAMGDEIAGYVDVAVVLAARPTTEVQNGKNVRRIVRVMQTFPDARQPWIKDRSGKLPMEFPINFEDDYKRLEELIFGASEPAPLVQETVLPTAEPIAQDEVAEPEPAPEPKKKAARKKAPAEKTEVPQPTPEPESEPEAPAEVVPEPEPEPESAETSVPERETVAATNSDMACADCGSDIHTKDQADLSYIRFRRRLCKDCFRTARTRK